MTTNHFCKEERGSVPINVTTFQGGLGDFTFMLIAIPLAYPPPLDYSQSLISQRTTGSTPSC